MSTPLRGEKIHKSAKTRAIIRVKNTEPTSGTKLPLTTVRQLTCSACDSATIIVPCIWSKTDNFVDRVGRFDQLVELLCGFIR